MVRGLVVGTVLGAALGALAALGCADPVRVEVDPQWDFARHRSWAWIPPAPPGSGPLVSPELDRALREAIARELAARGFAPAAADEEPAFRVGYRVELRREHVIRNENAAMQRLESMGSGGGIGSSGGVPAYEISASVPRLVSFETGTLVVEVAEADARQIVWRGIAVRRSRARFSERADGTVREIFAQFPSVAVSTRP